MFMLARTRMLKDKHTKTESGAEGAKKNNDETFLKELADQLDDCESSGPDINAQLAAIVNKRWSRKLAQEKLKPLLDKYKKPENCSALILTRVNPEIWSQLQSGKRRSDLKVANMQQCLHKVATATIQIANSLLQAKEDNVKPDFNTVISNAVESISLLGHVNFDLLNLRREQIRPVLKSEFAALPPPGTMVVW